MRINPAPVKCPHCGSVNLEKLTPPFGETFALVCYDPKTNSVNPGAGQAVNVFVCKSCGIFTLAFVSLKE